MARDVLRWLTNQTENDVFSIREPDEECGSLFGNFDIDIYDEDIEALKAGKQLYFVDEYGFRIHYKEGKKPEESEETEEDEFEREWSNKRPDKE